MKKCVISLIALSLMLGSVMAFAKSDGRILASEMCCETYINNEDVNVAEMNLYPMYTIDNRAYFPIRGLCKALGMKINWNGDKNEIDIQTSQEPKTDLGFEINKETAIKIADAVYAQFGSDFIEKHPILEVNDICMGKCFSISRLALNSWDGACVFVINKSDGKIVRFTLES